MALAFLSSPAGGGGVDDMASGGRADATGRWISLWWVCRRSPQLARVQASPCVSPPGQGPDLFLSPLSFAVLDWKSVQIISETFTQCFWGSIVIFLASISLYTQSHLSLGFLSTLFFLWWGDLVFWDFANFFYRGIAALQGCVYNEVNKLCVLSCFSCIPLFVTLWTVASVLSDSWWPYGQRSQVLNISCIGRQVLYH